jgi:photosystem II stability/assembly factor-like uncharacterized protein
MKKIIILMMFFGISIFYSQSGWNIINNQNSMITNIFFTSQNTGFLISNTETDARIQKTTNSGLNWTVTPLVNKTLWGMYFINQNTGFVCGAGNPTVMRTTDAGNSWIQCNILTSTMLSIYFSDNVGYVVGNYGAVYKTYDFGVTWISLPSPTNDVLLSTFFINGNIGFISGANGEIYKTINGGNNWTSQNSGTIKYLYGIYFITSDIGYVVGGYPNTAVILKTTNGGLNWNSQNANSNENLYGVFFVNTDVGYSVGYNGTIIKTTNGGNNWYAQNSGTSYWLRRVVFTDINIGYVVGYNASSVLGIVLKTFSGGEPLLPPILISPSNGSQGISLTPTLFWNTVPGAINYQVQVSSLSNFAIITDSCTVSTNQYQISQGKLQNSTTYFWRVKSLNSTNESSWSDVWWFSTLILSINNQEKYFVYKLYNNYPNPFSPTSSIKYSIEKPTNVKLIIYDVFGKEIKILVNKKQNSGVYEVIFDGSNLSSGIYFYKLETKNYTETKKMVLIK